MLKTAYGQLRSLGSPKTECTLWNESVLSLWLSEKQETFRLDSQMPNGKNSRTATMFYYAIGSRLWYVCGTLRRAFIKLLGYSQPVSQGYLQLGGIYFSISIRMQSNQTHKTI